MATSNETRTLERTASELMGLAGTPRAGLARAERELLLGLHALADRISSSKFGFGPGAGLGATTGLLSQVEGRYLTDDFGRGAPLGYATDWSVGPTWGGSAPGYWRFGDVDPVVIALEADEELQDALSESGDVRHSVRRSLFQRPAPTRGRGIGRGATSSTARAAAGPRATRHGAPSRPALWERPVGEFAHLAAAEQTPVSSVAGDGTTDARRAAQGPTQQPEGPTAPVDWTFPYPRTMGLAGARYLTPAARSMARFAGAGSAAGARGRLARVAQSAATRIGAGLPLDAALGRRGLGSFAPTTTGTTGLPGAQHAAAGPLVGGAPSRQGNRWQGGISQGASAFLLDGLPIGAASLPALVSALRVAHAAFGAPGAPHAGVAGPGVIDRMLGVARLTAATSSPDPSWRSSLDVDWVRPEPGTIHTAPAEVQGPRTARRPSMSLFDVVPRAAAVGSQPRSSGHAPAQRGSATAHLGALPPSEVFALRGTLADSGAPVSANPARLLGGGWSTSGSPAGAWALPSLVSPPRTSPLLPRPGDDVEGALHGELAVAPSRTQGQPQQAPRHLAASVLVDSAALGVATGRAPLRRPLGSGSWSGRMGETVRRLVDAVALSPSEAAMVLGVLHRAPSNASPEQVMRALTREGAGTPLHIRSVAEAILLDMPREGGLTSLQSADFAVETALGRRVARQDTTHAGTTRTTGGDHPRGPSTSRMDARGRTVGSLSERAAGAADRGPVRVSVRMPGGRLLPFTLGSRTALGGGSSTPLATGASSGATEGLPPLQVVLPAAEGQSALAALPTLVEHLDAQRLVHSMGTAQTDVARGAVLGLPEAVMASLRGLLERTADPQTALTAYRSLLSHAPELGMLAPELTAGAPGAADIVAERLTASPSRASLGRSLVALDTLRAPSRAVGSMSRTATSGASRASALDSAARTIAEARAAGPTTSRRGVSGTARGGAGQVPGQAPGDAIGRAAERLAWALSSSASSFTDAGAGLLLELVGREIGEGRHGGVAPASAARLGAGSETSSFAGARSSAWEALSPAARTALSSIGFADRHLQTLGLEAAGERTGLALEPIPDVGVRDYGLSGDLDLVTPEALAETTESSAGGVLGATERMLRRTERMVAGTSASSPETVHGATQAPVQSALLRGAGAELGFVVPALETGGPQSDAVEAQESRPRIGRSGRRASHFQPVSERVGKSGAPRTEGALSAVAGTGTAPGASGRPARGAVRSTRDLGFDAALVRVGPETPHRTTELATGESTSARHERSAAPGKGARRARGVAAPATRPQVPGEATGPASGSGSAAWTQLSSLIRRLSDGGSATPLQRELASLIDGLPTSAAAREAAFGGGVGFSRDLLVRLETAIDTLSGGRSVEELVAGLRGGGGSVAPRVSDLGASGLMSFVSPVLGSDPFSLDTATAARQGATRAGRSEGGGGGFAHVEPRPHAPVAPTALDDLDWSLVSPHAPAREGNRSTPDMGMLSRATLGAGSVTRADLPLIAPATMAVATQAQLSTREDRAPTASAPANAGKSDSKQAAEAKVDLDKLAVEMANRISIMSRVQLERRGIWQSHKT